MRIGATGLLVRDSQENGDRRPTNLATSIGHFKKTVDECRLQGKHVLYVPGSYDLAHLGHLAFINQAIGNYHLQNPTLKRDELVVIALLDDDDLIKATKGPERPVQNENDRLLDVAHLPTILPLSMVGLIPHPQNDEGLISSNTLNCFIVGSNHLSNKLEQFAEVKESPMRTSERLVLQ